MCFYTIYEIKHNKQAQLKKKSLMNILFFKLFFIARKVRIAKNIVLLRRYNRLNLYEYVICITIKEKVKKRSVRL